MSSWRGLAQLAHLHQIDKTLYVLLYLGQAAQPVQLGQQFLQGGLLFRRGRLLFRLCLGGNKAYALANQDNANDFGREAIEVLLKGMEELRTSRALPKFSSRLSYST